MEWKVWAPAAQQVQLVLLHEQQRREFTMQVDDQGVHSICLPQIAEGQRYWYRLDQGRERPDPCSLWQPDGVRGPSAVFRPDQFPWTDEKWPGFPANELIFYELHVGTFSPPGTFAGILPRLASLRDLGVTAIELMPLHQFSGTRNWGYDGVLPYAVQNSYGGPRQLQQLVDACHQAGLAVLLDVVYNHVGPEGNYLPEFGPYFTDRYRTPWGPALNYDDAHCDFVRDFVLDNVRMWLQEFHVDGLRLDAVHAIFDFGARHILQAIKEVADDVAQRQQRLIHIVAESDLNDPRLILPVNRGGHGLDAQWSDDFHHAVHAHLSNEREGYYADFGAVEQIAQVMESPFLYAWTYSKHRKRKHGAPAANLPAHQFVVCIQNHDQVGNRCYGERLSQILEAPSKLRLAACLLLLSPYQPLLFMGEEYGEENPFPYFCSFDDQALIEAVREGRRQEFSGFTWAADVPDPQAPQTFDSAKLSWRWQDDSRRSGLRQLYQDLLTARRVWRPLASNQRSASIIARADHGGVLEVIRGDRTGEHVRLLFNLSDTEQALSNSEGASVLLFTSEATRYGGMGRAADALLQPYECLVVGPASLKTFYHHDNGPPAASARDATER